MKTASATREPTAKEVVDRAMAEVDPEALAADCERRYLLRCAQIDADVHLDPKVAEWYRDRTLWDSADLARELDVTLQRIYQLRAGSYRTEGIVDPDPAVMPPTDAIVGVVAGVPSPGNEAGAIRRWAVMRGSHRMNRRTGKLIKLPHSGHGRPRSGRLNLSHRRNTDIE